MKVSAATAMVLGMAPLALGKSVHNVYPGRRDGHMQGGKAAESVKASDAQIAELARLIGLNRGSGSSINFLWVNLGGGAATTVLGSASTVTVTQTVVGGGAAATPPPAGVTGEAGSSTVTAPPSGTTAASPSQSAHTVTVGGPQGLAFSPQQLKAAVGDTVIFTFLSQNHTATQSGFKTPCDPLSGGMDSGFQANPNNTVNPPPQVAMQIMVDTPLWFYCKQGNHCGRGMVFSINPTADKTHAQFQAMAIQQKGKGAGSAITGNAPPADPNASAVASASPSGATPAVGGGAAATDSLASATSGAAGAANTGVVTGVGKVAPDGSCVCAVQCSFPGFPNQQVQGRDNFGGYGGSIPMAMVQPARRRA